MAFPLPRGITPPEISFLAEMEMVTILPRQRLEGLELLGGPVSPSSHPDAPPSHSGSPSSSNANAAPTSSPRPGSTPNLSNSSLRSRPKTTNTSTLSPRRLHCPASPPQAITVALRSRHRATPPPARNTTLRRLSCLKIQHAIISRRGSRRHYRSIGWR
ncbi:DNA replication protein psf2 [Aspergillus luchuensis]|nr:DNA replication protein psf2 [Aspergillus luchuensis]